MSLSVCCVVLELNPSSSPEFVNDVLVMLNTLFASTALTRPDSNIPEFAVVLAFHDPSTSVQWSRFLYSSAKRDEATGSFAQLRATIAAQLQHLQQVGVKNPHNSRSAALQALSKAMAFVHAVDRPSSADGLDHRAVVLFRSGASTSLAEPIGVKRGRDDGAATPTEDYDMIASAIDHVSVSRNISISIFGDDGSAVRGEQPSLMRFVRYSGGVQSENVLNFKALGQLLRRPSHVNHGARRPQWRMETMDRVAGETVLEVCSRCMRAVDTRSAQRHVCS